MSTMTGTMRRAILCGVVGSIVAIGGAVIARADVSSDKPGAILIFPKIVVDTSGVLGPPTDTEIQITNTTLNAPASARCWLVDATSRCTNAPDIACTQVTEASSSPRCPANGVCAPHWSETDFQLTLTKRQPISWKASEGLNPLPCDDPSKPACAFGEDNRGTNAPRVQDDPFIGELKCVQVDADTNQPTVGFDPANNFGGDLKGEVTIVSASGDTEDGIDARKYNAITLAVNPGNPPPQDDGVTPLILGGPNGNYDGCPSVLIVDDFFDGATLTTHHGAQTNQVRSDLTFVPCAEDFRIQENNLGGATLQFLVFNEFEQRFSTSTSFSCFSEIRLSDIDTRPGPTGDAQSIFNVNVQGTVSGQIRIRPVAGTTNANTIVAVLENFIDDCTNGPTNPITGERQCSAASNVHFAGTSDQADELFISPLGLNGP
jgi:hypothetical protein